MVVSKDTKISEILKANDKAIEAIASVNKNFRKLQNPFLRKLFASRVSIKDAAKIGGTSVNEILNKLEAIGFKVEYSENEEEPKITVNKDIIKKGEIVTLDVRPILDTGADPYHAIIDTLKNMNENESLLIINTFEPVPLLNKLKSQGYSYEVERPDEKTVHTYVTKTSDVKEDKQETKEIETEVTFDETKEKYEGKMIEIDVRNLEMPLPMVTILQEIEKIDNSEALFVYHKRLPQYLIPELESRGWSFVVEEIDEHNMNFIIFKK